MYQILTKTAASANSCSAMGRETISKSRVSPKNDRSRGSLLFVFLLLGTVLCNAQTVKYDSIIGEKFTGLLAVKLNSKWGFIERASSTSGGNLIIPLKYDDVLADYSYLYDYLETTPFILNYFVKQNGKWGIVNPVRKQEIMPCKYDKIVVDKYGESQKWAAVKLYNKWSYYNMETGIEIMPFVFDYVDDSKFFQEGLARVQSDSKVGFVNETGKTIVSPKYDETSCFMCGFSSVTLNGKMGIIDTAGKEIVSPKYDDAEGFCNDLALVKLNGKYGYIDKTGKEIVSPKYDDAKSFDNGYAKVVLAGNELIIDKKGNEKKGLVALDQLVYDFGEVQEGKEVSTIFRFRNDGNQDVVITQIIGGAGVKAVALEQIIKSGATGRIQVTFKPYLALFMKPISVRTNSEPTIKIIIKGTGTRL